MKVQGCFEAWKVIKKYQGAKIEKIQAWSQDHKKRTIQFEISEYPVFAE
jgi:hypothetical protein